MPDPRTPIPPRSDKGPVRPWGAQLDDEPPPPPAPPPPEPPPTVHIEVSEQLLARMTKAEVARDELREVTTEAHAAIKDLGALIREGNQLIKAIDKRVHEDVGAKIEDEVRAGLAEYQQTVVGAIEPATEAVYKRFDDIADMLLGEDRRTTRQGLASIPEMAQRIRERETGDPDQRLTETCERPDCIKPRGHAGSHQHTPVRPVRDEPQA